MTDREPGEDRNRGRENAALLGLFLGLIAAGVWLLSSMAELRKIQDCAGQGRRNCEMFQKAPPLQ